MKRLIIALCGFQMLIAWAQPVSISGITPGRTTIADLKDLLVDGGDVKDGENLVSLKELGKLAEIKINNGVVYEVKLSLMSNRDILSALKTKYGEPKNISGKVRSIKCQNGLGASFDGYEGAQLESWPVKEGVVASIEWVAAYKCAKFAVPTYYLRHVETNKQINEILMKEKNQKENDEMGKLKKSL